VARFDRTDGEWAIVSPLLPGQPRGMPRVADRRVPNAILHVLRTGSPRRDLVADRGYDAVGILDTAAARITARSYGSTA
jgi:transposase